MMRMSLSFVFVLALSLSPLAAAERFGLKEGTPDLQAAGPLAFGPPGILFVGDPQQAAIFALDTGDTTGNPSQAKPEVKGIKEQLAALLGVTAADVLINDLAVNPASGNVYLSVSRGKGPDAAAVLVKVDDAGKLSEVSLKKIPFAKTSLANAPAPGGEGRNNRRVQSITDLAFMDGRLFVAGLSNEEFASKLRSISFPFAAADSGASIEIFHGAHGAIETRSPIRTFLMYQIEGQPHLLAAYTCTPLVKLKVADLQSGAKVKGTTIAELGNRNSPLDMIAYEKDGKNYLLIANTARGVMKVGTEKLATVDAITAPVKEGTAGLTYETIADWKGVTQLDLLNRTTAVLLVEDAGTANLVTMALP